MRKRNKIVVFLMLFLIMHVSSVQAHGGNITGWKDKDSEKIMEQNGKYYGFHKQDGKTHYHEVKWNEEKQKWEIVKTAICYDENLNKINLNNLKETEKIQVQFSEEVDGDTAKFEQSGNVITVRFLGIDTPETVHPTKKEEPFGKEASNFTKEKLQNATKIELEYDSNAPKTDKYERHLAWIWVDDDLLQEQLVKNGLAKTYMLQDNYQYAGILQDTEEQANLQKIGIWSQESYEIYQDEEEQKIETENAIEIVLLLLVFIIALWIKVRKKR